MIEQALSMDTLSELVLDQLREHGYKESSCGGYTGYHEPSIEGMER